MSDFNPFEAIMVAATKPQLDDGETYPALVVEGPGGTFGKDVEGLLPALAYNPEKGSMGFWFRFLVNKAGVAAWSDASDLVELRHYVYLGKVNAPGNMSDDDVKRAFLEGAITFDGTPSSALFYLQRNVLGKASSTFDLGALLYRVVSITIRHEARWAPSQEEREENERLGINQARIHRISAFADELTGEAVQLSDLSGVAWSPSENAPRQTGGNDLF